MLIGLTAGPMLHEDTLPPLQWPSPREHLFSEMEKEEYSLPRLVVQSDTKHNMEEVAAQRVADRAHSTDTKNMSQYDRPLLKRMDPARTRLRDMTPGSQHNASGLNEQENLSDPPVTHRVPAAQSAPGVGSYGSFF